jgi:hypothetical protein
VFVLDLILTTSGDYLYSYFLDNTRTVNHLYAMFGLRELNLTEFATNCPNNTNVIGTTAPINDQTANFTANYQIRAYTSGCYYLDKNYYWQSVGMVVS